MTRIECAEMEADDVGGAQVFAQWFRAQILDLHGMDLASPPPPNEIYYQYP